MDGVKEVTGCRSIGEIIRTAEDRNKWRYIVANVSTQDTARRLGKVTFVSAFRLQCKHAEPDMLNICFRISCLLHTIVPYFIPFQFSP